jgi:serine/threonine protein kinase
MNSEEYQKITRIFEKAAALAPHQRPTFLAEACAGDENARREVEEMLAIDDANPELPGESAIKVVALVARRLEADEIIGERYKILEEIGKGGMGEVFAAEDLHTKRKVALKVLSARFSEDLELARRFRQEGDAVAKLDHPNIVRVHDIDTINGVSFLVTEFIEGVTLRERLDEGALNLPEALEIVQSIAEALNFAHAKKIVHRDIKPENIMLSNNEHDGKLTVKVLDFGLAKFTEENSEPNDAADYTTRVRFNTLVGTIMGTPAYMSPEQVRGKQTDERSDIWNLGVVFYEMLRGENPFFDRYADVTKAAILERNPAPLDNVSPELNGIIGKALQKNLEERYQTIRDFQLDLKNVKNNDGADTFTEWLSGLGKLGWNKLVLKVILIIILVSVLGLAVKDGEWAVSVVSVIHVVALWFALRYFDKCKPKGLASIETKDADNKLSEDDRKATDYETAGEWKAASNSAGIVLKQYLRDWKGILMAWFALYFLLILKGLPPFGFGKLSGNPEKLYQDLWIVFLSIIITGLNNYSAWKIFLCFNLLNKQTEIRQEDQTVDDPAYSNGFKLVVAFSIVEVLTLAVFWALMEPLFAEPVSPAPVLVKSVLVEPNMTRDVLTTILQVFSGASGIIGGIAMALYVGRLQNKFIGTATAVSIALYSYTAIQPLFLFLEGDPYWAVALIDIALFLKCLLFLYMAWLFQSGRLLYYLVRVRRIYPKLPEDWRNFRKVLRES